jgi:DNA invertase Pin-like site-specific DNA recombinase
MTTSSAGRTIGYIRVSTRGQAESGLGLDAQRAGILAARSDATIVVETGSAKDTDGRPVLLDLLGELDRAGGTLIVAKLDRLARSAVDFGEILRRSARAGWTLVVLDLALDTSTPVGKFTATVMAAVAELERDLIAQRTRDALAAKRARGERTGPASVLDPRSAERIRADRAAGHSWAAIADGLNADGCKTPTGRAWTRESVRSAAQVGDSAEASRRRDAHRRGLAA